MTAFVGIKKKSILPPVLKQPRYFVTFIWFIIYLTITIFTTQGLSLFNPGGVTHMSDVEFYTMFSASVLLGVGLIVYGMRFFKVKISWAIAALALVLIAIDAIALAFLPDSISANPAYFPDYQVTLEISNAMRARFFCSWVASTIGIYLFLAVVPKIMYSHRTMDFWFWVGVFVALGLLIASYIKDFQIYNDIFHFNPATVDPDFNISDLRPFSLCNNANTFGFAVFWGLCCTLILHAKYRRPINFILGVYFLFSIILIGSKNSIFTAGVVSILYLIWALATGWQKRRAQQIVIIVVVLAIGLFILLLFLVPIPALRPIRDIVALIFKIMAGLSGGNFTGRVRLWNIIWGELTARPTSLIFGIGDGAWEYWLSTILNWGNPDAACTHNGFFMVLGRFGFIGLAIYLALIVYICVKIYRSVKIYQDKWMSVLVIVLAGIILHSMLEDTTMFDFELKGVMTLGIVYLPLGISRNEYLLHRKAIANNEGYRLQPRRRIEVERKPGATDTMKLAYFISMGLMVLTVAFAPLYKDIFGSCFFFHRSSLIGLMVTFLLCPLLFVVAHMQADKGRKAISTIYIVFGLLVSITSVVVAFATRPVVYTIVLAVVLMIALILGIQGTKGSTFRWSQLWVAFVYIAIGIAFVGISHYLSGHGYVSRDNRSIIVYLGALYLAIQFLLLVFPAKQRLFAGSLVVPIHYLEWQYEKIAVRRLIKGDERIKKTY